MFKIKKVVMKAYLILCIAGLTLAGCGGGSGNTPPPKPPAPPPAPTVKLLSAAPTRISAADSGLSFTVTVQPSVAPAGTLYVLASDKAGIIQPAVVVSSNGDGSYALAVDTVATLTAGHYVGDLTLKLCADQACATAQTLPPVTVPYDITVLATGDAWPGNHLTPLQPWIGVADWSTYQGNSSHTAYVPVTLDPNQFTLRWKSAPLDVISGSFSDYGYGTTLTAANGVFYSSGYSKLQASKEFDGSALWSYDFSSIREPNLNPPSVSDGIVYMAAGSQQNTYMFAFDATSGTLRFKSQMQSQFEHYLAPTIFAGSAYTNGGTYGGIYGFAATGETLFFDSLSQTSVWTPAADANAIYAYTADALTIIDGRTGVIQSKIKDPLNSNYLYQVNGSAVLGAQGSVFGANYANALISDGKVGNSLIKFNTLKGTIDWRLSGVYAVTPAYANGSLYAPNNNPYRIEARSETDGGLSWSWTPPVVTDNTWNGEPIVTKNILFASTNSATYGIDLATHKVVWSYPAAGRLALTQSGILYIQNSDALVAINVK